MKEVMGFTPGPWEREDGDVYALNKKGSNRFCFNVQCGWDDEGNRVDCDEVYAVARLCQVAPELYAECKQLTARVQALEEENARLLDVVAGTIKQVEFEREKKEAAVKRVQELEEENKNLGLALSDKQFEYAANVLAAESDKYGFERQRARIVELEARLAQAEGLLKEALNYIAEISLDYSGLSDRIFAFLHLEEVEKEETIKHMEEVSAEVAAWSEEKRRMLGTLAEGFEQELRQVSTTEAQMANDSDLAGKVEKEGGE